MSERAKERENERDWQEEMREKGQYAMMICVVFAFVCVCVWKWACVVGW